MRPWFLCPPRPNVLTVDRLVVHAVHRRLVVERVDMAGAAVHVEEDHALGLGREVRLLGGQRVGELRYAVGGDRLPGEKSIVAQQAANAVPVNPAPACQRNSRRVRPQKLCCAW